MCDKAHFDNLESRVDALEQEMRVYHAKTDERIKTLFETCEKLASTASLVQKASLAILGTVLIVSVFALVYGAIGSHGFNAVTSAAQHASVKSL